MRLALLRSEAVTKKKLSVQKSGVDMGVWIEQMISSTSLGSAASAAGGVPVQMNMEAMDRRTAYAGAAVNPYAAGAANYGAPPAAVPAVDPAAAVTAGQSSNTNTITLICRAISMTSIDPSANRDIAYAVQDEIKASPLVDPKLTLLDGNIVPDDSNGTFTFTLKVALLNPLNF